MRPSLTPQNPANRALVHFGVEFQAGSFKQEGKGGTSHRQRQRLISGQESLLCEGLGTGEQGKYTPRRSSGGCCGPQPLCPGSLEHKHVASRQLFLAGSWDIMIASILEILFTAREIARFGGNNNQF